jgi:catechol 2,3-dioxygenase-like lactoylglutathione lyase family enzyme
MSGIDHVTITTRDCRAAKRFYELALRPLGFSVVLDWPERGRAYLGLPAETSSLWIVQRGHPGRATVSLAAVDQSAVDAFYAAALAAGGEPVSPPAHRPEYTARTYAAEVLDPDGNTLEAVCWRAEPLANAADAA